MPDDVESGSADAVSDIENILTGTSAEAETTQEATSETGAQAEAKTTEYKFGGRSYKTQAEAEKAHNALYGKYSEQQGLLNRLKQALSDPAKAAKLASDPAWADIMAKLGIEQAEQELAAQEVEAAAQGRDYSKLPNELQQFVYDQQVQAESIKLDREEWSFERKLGRPLTNEEHNAVMEVISRAHTLTFEEAWKLAHHDKLLRDAAEKAKAKGANGAQPNRPPPRPGFVPGVKLDLKKPVTDMSNAEFREHLRNSEEFKRLLARE